MVKEKEIKLNYYAPHRTYPVKKYDILKKAIVKVIKNLVPEINVKFDLNKILSPIGTKGLLRAEYKSLKEEDRYAFHNIIQELVRKDKKLFCVGGRMYCRI